MPSLTADEIEAFVSPFYATKDTMHDLTHIRRIRRQVIALAEGYAGQVDEEVLLAGAYFHGVVDAEPERIADFLQAKGIARERIERILETARESHKSAVPQTLEGKILHDAQLIEGNGPSFLIVKCLVTGSARGQTFGRTLDIIENNILGKFHCYLPEAQSVYAEKVAYAWNLLAELKGDLT